MSARLNTIARCGRLDAGVRRIDIPADKVQGHVARQAEVASPTTLNWGTSALAAEAQSWS